MSGKGTGAFSPFEWMLALRYLRARRKEGFISVIAGFSFLGIMLGVATLIIVMAVMNGFRHDLFNKILGLNGHVIVHKIDPNFDDYDAIAGKVRAVPGVKTAAVIEGQVMVSTPHRDRCARARHARGRPEAAEGRRRQHSRRHARRLRGQRPASPSARGLPTSPRQARRSGQPAHPARRIDTVRHGAPHQAYHRRHVRDRHVRIRPHHDLHAACRGAAIFLQARQVDVLEIVVDTPDEVGAIGRRSSRPGARRSMSATGGSATRHSSPCSRSSATSCSSSSR